MQVKEQSSQAPSSLMLTFVFFVMVVVTESMQAQTLTTLHSFSGADGDYPYAGLVQASDGNFYGTTSSGGAYGSGTVFQITPSGTLTTLHSFSGGLTADQPYAGLVQANDGNFYGTTYGGGAYGYGSIFNITPSGTFTSLYSFCLQSRCTDGSNPHAGLIQASDGNFYGTTYSTGYYADGTVFKITPGGALTTLHSFCSQHYCSDGALPAAGLIQASDGNFYGTTSQGGADQSPGTVFQITPSGTLTTLHSFDDSDGNDPYAGLVQGTDGNFYGTTTGGGANYEGTVFKITPGGTLTTLHSFSGADGVYPYAGLVQASDGNFYGTTSLGGAYGSGTVFQITPSGTLTTLHSFSGADGDHPYSGLVQASDGNFYGTTFSGGAYGYGVVFEITGLPPATVKITDISMFDSHTLRVDVTARFSQDPRSSKQLTVNTNIEDVPLESILPLPSRDTGLQVKSLFIDLAANNVPRFADNQVFNVTATATEGQQQLGTDSKPGEIPLPVVHIHGILTDCFGNRIPVGLFQYLSGVHPSYVEDDGSPDGHGTNNHLTQPYPTLVSFDYQSLQMPAEFIAGDFTSWIENELLPKTYASKVNVVAHSLGGIVARSAVVYSGLGPHVNELILVGSPTEGAGWASFAIAHWGRIKAFLLLEQFLRPEVGLVFANVLDCMVSGTQDTASELLPSYPWWAPTLYGNFGYYPGYENPLLPALNAQPLDPSISYYAIVASGARAFGKTYTSEVFWGNRFLWFYDIVQDWTVALGPGDGIVPIRSQLALDVGWPRGVGPGKLDIFDDVGDVFHTTYFDQFQVQIDIETILWPGGQLLDEANISGSSRGTLGTPRSPRGRVARSTDLRPQNLGNVRPD